MGLGAELGTVSGSKNELVNDNNTWNEPMGSYTVEKRSLRGID